MKHYFLCTKVNVANRTLTFSNIKMTITRNIFAVVNVTDGVMYLAGDTIVAIWDRDVLGRAFESGEGTETWSAPSLREARKNFVSMSKRFSYEKLS